jgi:hypothetical protein
MARPRVYLFITDTGVTVWSGSQSQLAQTHAFQASAEGLSDFERFVADNRAAQYSLVLDLQEEDYRAETIPHVGSRDRKKVLKRRLEQLYRETPYRSATPQGRETGGRRDDRVLLAALTNPKPVDQWMNRLAAKDVQVVGIYSVTLLTARHARQLSLIPPRALIVTRQFGSGLRQTYISDGILRFSRLTLPEEEGEQSLANQLAGEAARARQFLASLRAIERQEAMHVVMIGSDEEIAHLSQECPDTELIQYQFIPISALADALGVSTKGLTDTSDPVWLRLVAAKRPSNQYATRAQRKAYLAWQTGRALFGVAGAALVASVALSAYYWQDSRAMAADTLQQQNRKAHAEQVYAANAPKSDTSQLTPAGMKNVVVAYRQLVEEWPRIKPSLDRISTLLEQFPMMEIDELAWQVTPDANATPTGFGDAESSQPAQAGGAQGAVDASGNPLPATRTRYIVIALKGRLPNYELRPREALALVDRIATAAATSPEIKVSKLSLPIDIRTEKAIDLGTDNQSAEGGAPFSLRITVPLTDSKSVDPAKGAQP